MKKTIAVLLAVCVVFSLAACGAVGQVNDALAAKRVDDMIADLGDTVTLESEDAIVAAEEAYNALSDEQKAKVEYASYLPIYRNNLDMLKQEARQKEAFAELSARLPGEWIDLYDPENNRIEIREDGTASISDFEYEWTLNPNLETIRFEGNGRIVLAVEDHDGLLVLQNPELMTCMKQGDYSDFESKAIVTVSVTKSSLGEYFGDAMDLGPLLDADGKETGARLFAFRSSAYDNGLVFFRSGDAFKLEYSAGKKLHGALYEPYGASYITDAKLLASLKATDADDTITFIRSQYVSDLCFDAETGERVITLTNGIELRTSSGMNPSYKGSSFNAYDYLADPDYVF